MRGRDSPTGCAKFRNRKITKIEFLYIQLNELGTISMNAQSSHSFSFKDKFFNP